MIAMALALNPKLLIADEPTTALDVTVQAQILQLIKRLQQEFGTAVILITHDLGVIADVAETCIVMYAGRVMEYADRRTLYHEPHHPYTEGLTDSLPAARAPRSGSGRCRSAAEPAARAGGLPVPPALRLRHAALPDRRRRRSRGGRRGGGHLSACWLPPRATGLGADAEALVRRRWRGTGPGARARSPRRRARGPEAEGKSMTA